MYDAMFQMQSKALFEKTAEMRGVFFRVRILLTADCDGCDAHGVTHLKKERPLTVLIFGQKFSKSLFKI